jgi:hypothetical protein
LCGWAGGCADCAGGQAGARKLMSASAF